MRTNDLLRAIDRAGRGGSDSGPRKTGNKALDRFSSAVWLAEQGKDYFDKAQAMYRAHTTWTVSMEESDQGYPIVQQWLMDRLPQTKQKHVLANSKTVFLEADGTASKRDIVDELYASDRRGTKTSETKVDVALTDTQNQKVVIDGHKVQVRVCNARDEPDDPSSGRSRRAKSSIKNGKIIFTCRSVAAQNAVIALLNDLIGGKSKRKPALWVADGWGSWRQQDVPVRKLDSVILADGVKEDIMGDIQKFLNDEKRYVELGIPWHRGYLFHGPAGTGKTSLIKALAADLGLDLWYAPLGDLKEDSSLVDLIRSVNPRGVLLLEDVDSYSAARDREDEEGDAGKGITTSALLNALDGVVTPHGLITIMTTNHIDKLDPALVRSGRADRTIKLDLPGWSEVDRLWNLFFPDEITLGEEPGSFVDAGVSQATISEVFKRYWDTPDQARIELRRMIDDSASRILS